MGLPSGPELLIIIFIILLLFGAKKLPELAQGLGKGIREFKKATQDEPPGLKDEDNKKQESESDDKQQ
jgi:sec-independent protein translocase protein TatA